MAARPRVIVALPDASECAAIADWLVVEGLEPVRRLSPGAAAEEVRARAFDLLITDTAFAFQAGLIALARERNSRTPTLVISDYSAEAGQSKTTDRRAMYLLRPVDRATLLCTVSMAILEGRQVRRSARKLVNRFDAIVGGVPSHIIDVSKEGLRLEIPRNRRTAPPPPYFRVRLPLIGAAVDVKRMWARPWTVQGRSEVTLCGGVLLHTRTDAARAWQVFVDTIAAGNESFDSLQIQ